MNVLIFGGTGLLGSAAAQIFIDRGHHVKTIALPPLPEGAPIPKEMEIEFGNFLELSDEQLEAAMTGMDAFVYAAGVDERVEFPHQHTLQPLSPDQYESGYRGALRKDPFPGAS